MPLLASGGLVLGNQIGGDPATILNVVPVLARPVPDFGRVHRRTGPPTGTTCSATSATRSAADLAGVADVLSESRAKLFRVLRVQVDLVFSPVESEPHGSLCCPAVNVVYEECCDLLSHWNPPFLVSTAIIAMPAALRARRTPPRPAQGLVNIRLPASGYPTLCSR